MITNTSPDTPLRRRQSNLVPLVVGGSFEDWRRRAFTKPGQHRVRSAFLRIEFNGNLSLGVLLGVLREEKNIFLLKAIG